MNRRRLLASSISLAAVARSGGIASRNDALKLGGDDIRLADILPPTAFAVRTPSPSLRAFGEFLVDAANEARLTIEDVGPRDRWGRRSAIITCADGSTLQERAIVQGLARVRPESDRADFVARLLALEAAAREGTVGLWKERYYRVRNPVDVEDGVGGFHLVEGVVAAAASMKSRAYLNFGPDYRTDFTASAETRLVRRWAKEGLDLAALEGRRVRVRGYVGRINGLSIELLHRQQLETLS